MESLTNPFETTDDPNLKVTARLDPQTFNYFFRKVLVGNRGAKQALIGEFFKRLHAACIADGIVETWEVDNEARICKILNRLNFNDHRPVSTRRSNPSPSKRKKQPVAGANDSRSAN